MAEVTTAMVKELRELTGAGMMDCKKALAAVEGDMDKAVDFLREKGLAGAQKKAGRIAAEGVVDTKISDDGKDAVIVEVNEIRYEYENSNLCMVHIISEDYGRLDVEAE